MNKKWLKVQHPNEGPRGCEIANSTGIEQICSNLTEGNAARLVACWNACVDVPVEWLEEFATTRMHDKTPSIAEQLTLANDIIRKQDLLLNRPDSAKFDEFVALVLDTLDDYNKNEWWGTERAVAKGLLAESRATIFAEEEAEKAERAEYERLKAKFEGSV